MLRRLSVLTMLVSFVPAANARQAIGVLHIKVALMDRERKATPVPRHALLISDNPTTAAPRRVVTTSDGTADVRLPPGNYTVESDQPVAFEGRAYQWTQIVDIVAGRDVRLDLTADNAEIGPVGSATSTAAGTSDSDPAFFLKQWQDSVVSIWTPTAHASGFLIDRRGLIATNQQGIGAATSVEVQVTPEVKVPAAVLVADARRGVAVLWIDPAAVASVRPLRLGCTSQAPVVGGQRIYAIEAPLHQEKGSTDGTVKRAEAHTIASDLMLGSGGAGGPVFTAAGDLAGLTEETDDGSSRRRVNVRVVPIGDICETVNSAEQKMKEEKTAPPKSPRLPTEPATPFPIHALEQAARTGVGSLSPYQMSSSDFDIAFITPVMTYGAQHPPPQTSGGGRNGTLMGIPIESAAMRPLLDFSNWSEYVDEFPPVVLIRVTPKQVEGFWTKVARGAAQTQGMVLPPIKHFKTGFDRLRTFCGDREVTPIHPFKLERRVSETDAIYEGLYAFDPGALAPSCGAVKLVLYSEKEPERGDARVVDAKVIDRIWQDFEPHRALKRPEAR